MEGPRKEEIESARAQVAQAQAALKLSEANRLEVQRREQDLEARRADMDRARAQVAITDTQINDTEVYSPMDGVVLVKSAEVGEVLAAGTTVVTIGDIDHPWLRAYINETDLGRVKIGPRPRSPRDSFPGKAYPRPRVVHLLGGGVHAQADPDAGRAREAGLPHQDRSRQSAATS